MYVGSQQKINNPLSLICRTLLFSVICDIYIFVGYTYNKYKIKVACVYAFPLDELFSPSLFTRFLVFIDASLLKVKSAS